MKPRQFAITIVSTTVLTLYTIRFMFWGLESGIGSNHIILYAITMFFISGLAWKAILPNRNFLDVGIREGAMFQFWFLLASGWVTMTNAHSFNQMLSMFTAFVIAWVVSWVMMNVIIDVMFSVVAKIDSKPKRQAYES